MQCTEGLSSVNIRKLLLLRGSVPKNGPIDFASKNHFSLNSAVYFLDLFGVYFLDLFFEKYLFLLHYESNY